MSRVLCVGPPGDRVRSREREADLERAEPVRVPCFRWNTRIDSRGLSGPVAGAVDGFPGVLTRLNDMACLFAFAVRMRWAWSAPVRVLPCMARRVPWRTTSASSSLGKPAA